MGYGSSFYCRFKKMRLSSQESRLKLLISRSNISELTGKKSNHCRSEFEYVDQNF